jgi:hypothetical protein
VKSEAEGLPSVSFAGPEARLPTHQPPAIATTACFASKSPGASLGARDSWCADTDSRASGLAERRFPSRLRPCPLVLRLVQRPSFSG